LNRKLVELAALIVVLATGSGLVAGLVCFVHGLIRGRAASPRRKAEAWLARPPLVKRG
jgi:hypothetical protein